MRKEIYDIALYSEGAFKISELWMIPQGYLVEIANAIVTKNEKEKQAMDRAKGIRTTTF